MLLVAPAINNTSQWNPLWFVVFALLVFGACFGFTLIFWPHMPFRRLSSLGKLLARGLLSGFVAVGLATSIDSRLEPPRRSPSL